MTNGSRRMQILAQERAKPVAEQVILRAAETVARAHALVGPAGYEHALAGFVLRWTLQLRRGVALTPAEEQVLRKLGLPVREIIRLRGMVRKARGQRPPRSRRKRKVGGRGWLS